LKLELFLTPKDFTPEQIKGKAAVVIDVLRASTTIITAFQNQCRQIIPVAEVEAARNLIALQSKTTTLLCGERHGRKIEGFHLGNSPLEYTLENVRNKTLIFTSTNGSRLLTKTQPATVSMVASFVNVSKIVEFLLKIDADVAILCAGSYDKFSFEDTVCAGMIAAKLFKVLTKKLEFSDLELAAMLLSQKFENDIVKMLRLSRHGRYLISIGFMKDLVACANVDSIDLVPVFYKGVIALPKSDYL